MRWLASCVLGIVLAACGARATDDDVLLVFQQPPQAKSEPVLPRTGFIWMNGHWAWREGKWRWTPGRWEHPRAGYTWTPGRWERRGQHWEWVEGQWTVAPVMTPVGPLPTAT